MSATSPLMPVDHWGDGRWMSLHQHFVQQSREQEPDVIFIGDSILQKLQFTESWKRYIEPLHSLNFGIAGDGTSQVLWRISEGGELDHCQVKVVVLFVGSENPPEQTPSEIVAGIDAIINVVAIKQPGSSVIVMGLLPCGQHPNPKRERHQAINKLLQRQLSSRSLSVDLSPTDGRGAGRTAAGAVTFLCPDWELLLLRGDSCGVAGESKETAASLVCPLDMFDFKHLTDRGFAKVLLDPLVEELQSCVQTFLKTGGVTGSSTVALTALDEHVASTASTGKLT